MLRVGKTRPSSRHSERLWTTSPWKRRRLSLRRRPWCLPLPLRWALTTRHLYPRHLRSPSGRRGASLALPVTSSRASWSRRGPTIRSQRRASLAPSSPRTVLLGHLPRDLLARGRPRLLIAAVDSRVWPNLDIRAYTLPGSQATQEFNETSSRTKSCQLRLARLPRPSGPRAFGAEDHAPTDKVKSFPSRRDPSGPEGEGYYPLRGHGAAPTSPPGGVLRHMPFASTRSACLTSSGQPWADSGRPD